MRADRGCLLATVLRGTLARADLEIIVRIARVLSANIGMAAAFSASF